MSRVTSLVAVTDDSIDTAHPVPMANVYTYDQLIEQAKSGGGVASDGSMGTGADQVDADSLVGEPFVIVAAHINEGDYGDFVSLECRMPDGRLIVFNDGGKGVSKQFIEDDPAKEYGIRETIKLPMYCPHGLRASEYDLQECKCGNKQPRRSRRNDTPCGRCGEPIPAALVSGKGQTLYIDTRSATRG